MVSGQQKSLLAARRTGNIGSYHRIRPPDGRSSGQDRIEYSPILWQCKPEPGPEGKPPFRTGQVSICDSRARRCLMTPDRNSAGALTPEPPAAPAGAGASSAASAVPDDLHALRAVVEGTAGGTGREFFRSLVRHLAEAIAVPYASVCEFQAPPHGRALAFW